jgi:hypothetical protein
MSEGLNLFPRTGYKQGWDDSKAVGKRFWNNLHLMDKVALASSPIPIAGDILGAAADARMFYQEPESRTWGNAGLAALGLLPFVPPAVGLLHATNKVAGEVSDAARMFPKERGILGGVLAKNADTLKLDTAKAMQAEGIPREQIWKDTGWFEGVDGQWKFEIDDSGSKMTPDAQDFFDTKGEGRAYYLDTSEVLDHPELKKAYNTDPLTTLEYEPRGSSGSYTGGTPTTKDYFGNEPEINISAPNSTEARSVGLHELQHSIQEKEGFARGGSLDNAPRVDMDALGAVRKEVKKLDFDPYFVQNKLNINWDVTPEELDKLKAWELLKAQEDDILANQLDPYEAYKRLSGEVEARTVQKRMDLTPEQRVERPFWQDYDVPEEDQLIIFDDDGVMNSETKGALGLPMDDAARMKRAEEMGFNRDVYHGTTQDINEFDLGLANPESDMGAGIYTTNTWDDANSNYGSIDGQDLTQKIEMRAEQLEDTYGDMDKAREAAKAELYGNKEQVLELKARVENPVYVGGDKKTFIEMDYPEYDPKDFLDEAGGDMDIAEDLALEARYAEEPEGKLVDLMESLRSQVGDDANDAISTIMEEGMDGGLDADRIVEIIKGSESMMDSYDDAGRMNLNEVMRQAFEDAGFDGFIDQAPYNKWGYGSGRANAMDGIHEGTEHVIPFKPNQLRSKDAVFDPKQIDSSDLMSNLFKKRNTTTA